MVIPTLRDQTIVEGDLVTFRCVGYGSPFPSLVWSFNGSVLSDGDKYSIGLSGSEFGSLTIQNTSFNDRGSYDCTFNNTYGTASLTARLTVQGIVPY